MADERPDASDPDLERFAIAHRRDVYEMRRDDFTAAAITGLLAARGDGAALMRPAEIARQAIAVANAAIAILEADDEAARRALEAEAR